MRPTDILRSLGKPIAVYPSLTRLTGSLNATVFLCQLIFWQDKGLDPDGWIYKSQKEWEEETGLSQYEQRHARKVLGMLHILDEREAGIPCRLWYKLNTDALDDLWEKTLTNKKPISSASSSASHPQQVVDEARNKKRMTSTTINREYTENTSEITTESVAAAQPVPSQKSPAKKAADERKAQLEGSLAPYYAAYRAGFGNDPDVQPMDSVKADIRPTLLEAIQAGITPADLERLIRWRASDPRWQPFNTKNDLKQIVAQYEWWVGHGRSEKFTQGDRNAQSQRRTNQLSPDVYLPDGTIDPNGGWLS